MINYHLLYLHIKDPNLMYNNAYPKYALYNQIYLAQFTLDLNLFLNTYMEK